jgi:5-oxoprolinase (ATP-hydrolysing)
MDGELRTNVGVYRREALKRGDTFHGPAIVTEATGTTVVECGWGCECNARGCLVLRRFEPKVREAAMGTSKATRRTGTETSGAAAAGAEVSTEMSTSCGDVVDEEAEEAESGVDPIQLEIFNNLFMAIAEQMGVTLQNVSYSVNIKERLDFSCALFDPQGNLIANAPHVPVHLGSMSEAVKSVIRKVEAEQGGCMFPGDVFMMNAPYAGGTHIPDGERERERERNISSVLLLLLFEPSC